MKINQNGRSIVEMIGVLAIIGILSVGAIAGYSNAMNKYKMNKQVSQINQIISYINYNHQSISTSSYGNIIPLLMKLNIIPKEMIKNGEEEYVYDVFKNSIRILGGNPGSSWGGGNNITGLVFMANLLNDDTAKKVCANLLDLFKYYHKDVWYIELVSIKDNKTVDHFSDFYGDKYCNNNCLKDVNILKALDFCSSAVESTKGGEYFGYNIWWLAD